MNPTLSRRPADLSHIRWAYAGTIVLLLMLWMGSAPFAGGQFDFQGPRPRQIWIGAGIGITPFVARLQQLALTPDGKAIDLFHTTATTDVPAFARLQAAADAAGVRLHLMVDAVDGRLDAERLCRAVPDWRSAGVWFCGPAAFGRSLRNALLARGLARPDFHQELFEMR